MLGNRVGQHPTANIQHPASNIQHPTASVEHGDSLGVGCWMFGVGCFAAVLFRLREAGDIAAYLDEKSRPVAMRKRQTRPASRRPAMPPATRPFSNKPAPGG